MRILLEGCSSCGCVCRALENYGQSIHIIDGKLNLVAQAKKVIPDCVLTSQIVKPEWYKLLAENKFSVVGSSLWSSALRNDTYHSKLLLMLKELGIGINGGKSTFDIVVWWDGLGFPIILQSLTTTRFLTNNRGALTPFEWTHNKTVVPKREDVKELLETLKVFLNKTQHRGFLTLSCAFVEGKLHLCKLSADFRADIFVGLTEVVKSVDLLLFGKSVDVRAMEFGTLHVSLPPFPYDADASCVAVTGLCRENEKHTFFSDTSFGGYVTARGLDVFEVRRRLMRTLSHLGPDELQYRTDYGDGWKNVVL